jgi:hypothetical protein
LALVFGYVAKSQIDGGERLRQGRGLALTGIGLGWIELAASSRWSSS